MKKIVFASVLKPTNDVRTFWKLSQSIAKTNKYEVNIIGNAGKKESSVENIHFHPHIITRSNWINRLLVRWQILQKIFQIKPAVLVISTHELILAGLLSKLFLKCKLIYDVQENYLANLSLIKPSLLSKIYGRVVRCKELFSSAFVDQYWLAEKCYETELAFTKMKGIVIENKAVKPVIHNSVPDSKIIIFTGTISDYGGVKKAIEIYGSIKQIDPKFSMHIIGQIHDKKLKKWLEKKQDGLEDIKLSISSNPIAYDEILNAIFTAAIGVIGYEPNKVNFNKIPSKLYEYSRYKLPYIVIENSKWSKVGESLGGAIPTDFSQIDARKIIQILKKTGDLFPNSYPSQSTWEYESSKVLNSLNTLNI